MQNFIELAKSFFEEKFSTQFSIKSLNQIETQNSIGDLAVNLIIKTDNNLQSIYYFMDRKFARNFLKTMILELNDFDLNSDFTEKAVFEFNNQILKKLSENNINFELLEQNIIKDYQSKLDDELIKLSVTSLHSDQGDFIVGFSNEVPSKNIKTNNYSQAKKTSANVFNSSIIQVKEKSDDSTSSTSTIISTVQLLEIKKQVLTSLSEIKDLRGDPEFLLRKAKAVTDLTKLWFDILKEEN